MYVSSDRLIWGNEDCRARLEVELHLFLRDLVGGCLAIASCMGHVANVKEGEDVHMLKPGPLGMHRSDTDLQVFREYCLNLFWTQSKT